jgi:hypothetical protein
MQVDAQSGSSLKVIVNNDRQSGQVCVSSARGSLPCKYANSGESEEFQFSTNAVLEGEEFKACLEGVCQTGVNRAENRPEYVYFDAGEGSTNEVPSDTITEEQPIESEDTYDLETAILVLAIIRIIAVAIKKLVDKGKHKERRYFPDSVKENVLKKQNHRCAHCKRLLNVVDWHHKNGNKSDNRESNCQALCPNCHAIKTRSKR